MSTAHYALIPRDGLFCKDGRGWSTVTSGRGHALDWPHPSTLLGALRGAWGRAHEQQRGRAIRDWRSETTSLRLGRTLALHRRWGEAWQTMWPLPVDLRLVKIADRVEVEWLEPRPPAIRTIGRDGDAGHAREQLWTACSITRGKALPRPRWWSLEAFVAWLTQPGHARVAPHGATLPRRHQTHVSIGATSHTAIDGALFSHDVIETFDRAGEWAIGCELELPEPLALEHVRLGSDRRLASVEALPEPHFAVPPALPRALAGSTGLRLITVTPTEFERGWLPDGLREVESGGKREYRGQLPGLDCELCLRAAFVDRHVPVSGFDMSERKPKPTSRMVAPGSVYSFVRADGRPFESTHASSLWLAGIGQRQCEGFGRVVPGVWNPRP